MIPSVFHPKSSGDYMNSAVYGLSDRSAFGDKRLANRYIELMNAISQKSSVVFNQLSSQLRDRMAAYRFINNERVNLGELIYQCCQISPCQVEGQDLIAYIDGSAIGVKSNSENKSYWAEHYGVHGDNRSPGFYVYPSLIANNNNEGTIVGLGDILIYSRQLAKGTKAENIKQRTKRRALPLEEQESGVWSIVASNTNRRLKAAKRLTYVMDQAGDIYEVLQKISVHLSSDFIVRVKTNRRAKELDNGMVGTFSALLEQSHCWSYYPTRVRALNHYSKTKGRRIKRKQRNALLALKCIRLVLNRPSHYTHAHNKNKGDLDQVLYLVEVKEQPCSVPPNEEPIHWRLLTSWPLHTLAQAQQVVQAYQNRWHIEQLFRVLKKQGFQIEQSQYRNPYITEKIAVMALKASADALKLTQVRDGQTFVPIQTMFAEEECLLLSQFNEKLSGQTPIVVNPHQANSLAWAAWVIARLGHWSGYPSQRPPGPITMDRGLKRFKDFCKLQKLMDDP